MADIEVRHNLPDFKRQLAAFGQDFERRTMRSATNAAAQAFKKAVVAKAPVLKNPLRNTHRQMGTLKRAIYVKRSRDSKKGQTEHYFVGVRQGKSARAVKRKKGTVNLDAFYWYFLERGWIPRGPGRRLQGGRRRRAEQLEGARKSGARQVKYPFIAPAFQASKSAALQAFTAKVNQRIAQENAKRG